MEVHKEFISAQNQSCVHRSRMQEQQACVAAGETECGEDRREKEVQAADMRFVSAGITTVCLLSIYKPRLRTLLLS